MIQTDFEKDLERNKDLLTDDSPVVCIDHDNSIRHIASLVAGKGKYEVMLLIPPGSEGEDMTIGTIKEFLESFDSNPFLLFSDDGVGWSNVEDFFVVPEDTRRFKKGTVLLHVERDPPFHDCP